MVRQRAQRANDRALLPAALRARRHKDAGVLAPVAAARPLPARLVPERLPLRGEVAVASGDPEQEAVVLLECLGVGEDGDRGFGRGVHFREDFVGEGLGDSVEAEELVGVVVLAWESAYW